MLQAIGIAGLGAATGAPATGQETADAWRSYRADAANTAWVDGSDGVATAVEERWSVDPDLDVNYLSVRDGTLYASMDNGETDSYEGVVRAKDAVTGEQLWEYERDRWTQSTPVTTADAVYGVSNGGGDGHVFRLSAADGTEEWSRSLETEPVSSLAVVDGTVYVGEIDGTVTAMDAEDGTPDWSQDVGNRVWNPPAVVDGTVYVTGDNGGNDGESAGPSTVHALNATTGDELWQYDVGSQRATGSPAVSGGTAYVGDFDGTLHALSTDDGSQRWTFEGDDRLGVPPMVRDGTAYLGGTDALYALDAASGSVEWQVESEDSVTQPVGTTDVIYARIDGDLTAVYPATGDVRTLADVDGTPVAVVGDSVYINSRDSISALTVTERAPRLPVPTATPSPRPSPTQTRARTRTRAETPSPTPEPTATETAIPTDTPTQTDTTVPETGRDNVRNRVLVVLLFLAGAFGFGVLWTVWYVFRRVDRESG